MNRHACEYQKGSVCGKVTNAIGDKTRVHRGGSSVDIVDEFFLNFGELIRGDCLHNLWQFKHQLLFVLGILFRGYVEMGLFIINDTIRTEYCSLIQSLVLRSDL